ncbi:MAG: ATP-dependent 6-phosphofructokinase [Acidobacteriota bacterium]
MTPESTYPSLPTVGDLRVSRLGPCRVDSPLADRRERFVEDDDRVLVGSRVAELQPILDGDEDLPAFERAGARSRLFFDPRRITAGIVSCGGLCPGINNVVRALVLSLHHAYGVPRILGFRYGFAGLAGDPEVGPPLELTPREVEPIHRRGGSMLGSSRGPQDVRRMVDRLEELGVGILFAIGGDGTLRGASALASEIARRGAEIAVVGVPKTIDNDIRWIERSFGFATAVDAAQEAIVGAHAEARGAWNGIGMVKLMGRQSGFIAAHAALAVGDVNFCLVPESPFELGPLVEALIARLEIRRHAVLVVAEGAGQDLMASSGGTDASGNPKLGDIGPFLKLELSSRLKARRVAHTIKYIDPSYIVRSLPASPIDAEYCLMLGQHAVHAAMAGHTDLVVGYWNRYFTHVPIRLAVSERKTLDIEHGEIWQRVLETTGQPSLRASTSEI